MKYFKMKNEIEELKRQNLISIKKSIKLERENEELKKEIKRSKEEIKALENKQKKSNVINISMNKEDVDEIVKKVTENILGKQEHKCTPECFGKHVIKAIQKDYDSCSKEAKPYFLKYWYDNLLGYYPWLKSLCIINGEIHFSI